MTVRAIIGTLGMVAVVFAVAMPAEARIAAGAASPPPGPPCSLMTRKEAAQVLRVPTSAIPVRYYSRNPGSPPNGDCDYRNKSGTRVVGVSWVDFRSAPSYYDAYKDHRWGGCAKGPAISGTDKTCWDHGSIVIFGKVQWARFGACFRGCAAAPNAAQKARLAKLAVKVFSRFP
jgi:hypothetical protein